MDTQAKVKKRIRISRKPRTCPNPLFVSWLQELKDEAARKESRTQFIYGKALKSLQMYPLVFHSGKECKVLKHFGDTLCQMLDKRLEKYLADGGIIDRESESSDDECPPPKKLQNQTKSVLVSNLKNKDKEYIPARRSGAYALIIALYKDIGAGEYLTKKDLQVAAQPYADCSFTQTSVHERYSAWSAMSGLIKKGLVEKRSNPAKFNLSESGRALAMILDRAESEMQGIATSTMPSDVSFETISHQRTSEAHVFPKNQFESSKFKEPGLVTVPCTKDLQIAVDNVILIDDDEFGDVVPLFNKSNASVKNTNSRTDDISSSVAKDDIPEEFSSVKPISFNDGFDDIVPLYSNEDQLNQSVGSTSKSQDQQSAEDHIDKEVDSGTLFERVTLEHGQYDVVLCVDTAEVSGTGKSSNQKETASKAFQNCGVPLDFRKLAVGDYLWICKPKFESENTKELVLPFVVERKRLDDLVGSIKDGRFKEQKFRLKNSGLSRPMYLVEEYGSRQNLGFPEANLMQAIANTLIIEQFQVHWTRNSAESVAFLVTMTKQIIKMYRPLSISNMFAKQLMQLHALSGEKAEGIVAVYPTPRSLVEAFEAAGSAASQLLSKIEYGKNRRVIGPSLSATLTKLYTQNCFDV
uniref:Crossover junction endonuclease MUS81 n=1 Tax=Evadne anonyx TaxID=141404 RepID=A0A9N6ZE20_9CRUS|nr:EOG090X06E6 [Evadne anonyx]